MDKLWNKLLTKNILTRGWHLARLDTRQDFAEDLYTTDAYALDIGLQIDEIINRLQTETYQPNHLFRLEVPKGSLGFRPGSIIPIQDRVIVSAIVLLMAEKADKHLPNSVYSWRTKKPLPSKGQIFTEQNITTLPFLKKRTIKKSFDPFFPWYEIWPVFDKESRHAYVEQGYRFLATSDIAAYFENIQLPILRDLLLQLFPNEPKLVNLLFSFLESWALKTSDGRVHLRGIPQGNFVSSFLGNLFLLPLDRSFTEFAQTYEVRYFRYMDDVRVFAKRLEDARRAIFMMDRELKRLHLNVQTAKTKILDHKNGEINQKLIDERVDEISELLNNIDTKHKKKEIPTKDRAAYLRKLDDIAKKDIKGRQKILGARRPLEGLDSRTFIRWIYAHNRLKSSRYLDRLLREIQLNPENRLTKKLISTIRLFPKKYKIERAVLTFIESERNIFPHQEAECLRALRYLSQIHDDLIKHCVMRVLDYSYDPYVRMQAAYLLSRTEVTSELISAFDQAFDKEKDPYVQTAMSTILVQKRRNNEVLIRKLIFHPNEKISNVGKLYQGIKNDKRIAIDRLKHIFRAETPWLLCDNMPFIHLMANSQDETIRASLLASIREPRLSYPVCGLRSVLRNVFTRTNESLKNR